MPATTTLGSKMKQNHLLYYSILLPGDLESIDSCPICLDPIQAPAMKLSCSHVFCGRCISEWIGQHDTSTGWHCPMCRGEFHDT